MKRLYLTLFALMLVLSMQAQEGLLINAFFDKEYQRQEQITEVLVKGKKLKPYNLTLFRSITLKDAPDEAIEIEERLLKDAENAVEMKSASWGKRLYFGFYCLPPRANDKLRYIFYRNTNAKKDAKSNEVTLVYMEGYATLDEIEKMFK
jgi:hypothetical protein